jgi:hypothetical protein
VFLCRQSNAAVGMPYECVVSKVGLIGLTEPSLPAVAATPSGSLAYQVREYLQAFIARASTLFRLGGSPLTKETLTRGREAVVGRHEHSSGQIERREPRGLAQAG